MTDFLTAARRLSRSCVGGARSSSPRLLREYKQMGCGRWEGCARRKASIFCLANMMSSEMVLSWSRTRVVWGKVFTAGAAEAVADSAAGNEAGSAAGSKEAMA